MVGSAAICRDFEVDLRQSNALHDSKKCLKKVQAMFSSGTQTHKTSKKHVVHCKSKYCKFTRADGMIVRVVW